MTFSSSLQTRTTNIQFSIITLLIVVLNFNEIVSRTQRLASYYNNLPSNLRTCSIFNTVQTNFEAIECDTCNNWSQLAFLDSIYITNSRSTINWRRNQRLWIMITILAVLSISLYKYARTWHYCNINWFDRLNIYVSAKSTWPGWTVRPHTRNFLAPIPNNPTIFICFMTQAT